MYAHIHRSLLKLVQDTVTPLTLDQPVTVINFDAHSSLQELPTGDLAGPAGFNLTNLGQGHYELAFAVNVATQQDEDNFRLTDIVDAIYLRLSPESRFDVFDHRSGSKIGHAVVEEGTSASPVNRAEARNTVTITVTAQINPATPAD